MSARLIREDAPMEICNQTISDYRIVPIQEVMDHLKKGYQLWGQAFCVPGDELAQGMVKVAQRTWDESLLTPIERQCLHLWVQGYDYKVIARKVHRAHRSIEQIMQRIRKKYQCATPMDLMEKARHLMG